MQQQHSGYICISTTSLRLLQHLETFQNGNGKQHRIQWQLKVKNKLSKENSIHCILQVDYICKQATQTKDVSVLF